MGTISIKIPLMAGVVCLSFALSAQITVQEVDEINQEVFPLYTNIQTFNSHSMFQIPDGEYTLVFTTAAGHHSDSSSVYLLAVTDFYHVTPEQQAIADGDPYRHLWTYDRTQYLNPMQYADSLHMVLGQYFTITTNYTQSAAEVSILPNPAKSHIFLQLSEPFCQSLFVSVVDVNGVIVWNSRIIWSGRKEYNTLIGVEHLPPGHYVLILAGCDKLMHAPFIKD